MKNINSIIENDEQIQKMVVERDKAMNDVIDIYVKLVTRISELLPESSGQMDTLRIITGLSENMTEALMLELMDRLVPDWRATMNDVILSAVQAGMMNIAPDTKSVH